MADHPVKLKLRNDILPYLATARRLHKQWFYIFHLVFGYTTDILVAVTALGIVSPTVVEIVATRPQGEPGSAISEWMAKIPTQLAIPVTLLIVFWVLLRVVFIREEGQKKAVLAKSSRLVLRQAEAKLPRILNEPNPMPGIIKTYEELIVPTVDMGIPEGAWPWVPFAPGIEEEVEIQLAELCRKYESQWAPVDPVDRRITPTAGENHD